MSKKKFSLSESKFAFLGAPRFYSMVLVALAVWLKADGYITANLGDFITTVAGGFVVIGTIDRNVEYLSKARK